MPVDSIADIAILIHGCLLADFSTNTGSINPHSLQWLTWETQDTVVSANTENVLLTMETEYGVSFTVTVTVGSFEFPSQNIPVERFPGDPRTSFVIPEFPALIVVDCSYCSAIVSSGVCLQENQRAEGKLKDGSGVEFTNVNWTNDISRVRKARNIRTNT